MAHQNGLPRDNGPTQLLTGEFGCRTRVDKVSAELVVLTYGTIVAQLCKDYDGDYVEVNKQLDKMGYNIGLRLIEDYLAKSGTMKRCSNFRETAEMIAKVRLSHSRECSGCLMSLSLPSSYWLEGFKGFN
jgi:hypothetical protein